jgi:hypothetical protein
MNSMESFDDRNKTLPVLELQEPLVSDRPVDEEHFYPTCWPSLFFFPFANIAMHLSETDLLSNGPPKLPQSNVFYGLGGIISAMTVQKCIVAY